MRIQHNVTALNAYRNLGGNHNRLSKNLEKLSSGFRINRAGDDAAGLAVSEKMRAQITSLDTAKKNAQDGISLVQTAEGALTEVHGMLNRMVELAGQSANGTYDNEVDRANLQKEVASLKTEIDRISKASNFNGTKLLDGSLDTQNVKVSGQRGDVMLNSEEVAATFSTFQSGAVTVDDGSARTLNVEYTTQGKDGSEVTKSVTLNYNSTDNAGTNRDAMMAAITNNAELSELFSVSNDGTDIVLTSRVAGKNAARVTDMSSSAAATITVANNDATQGVNKGFKFQDGQTISDGDTLNIDGVTYTKVATEDVARTTENAFADYDGLKRILADRGVEVSGGDLATANLQFRRESAKGLVLQVGESSEEFQKIEVKVGDMSTHGLNISHIDISTQEGAARAIDSVKTAINNVSSTRGDLGALQNRLEHTISNLGVMHENITAAESRIRDTDMAKEMMAYTKNNILMQASQAMLAQANQLPQGVLQLLG